MALLLTGVAGLAACDSGSSPDAEGAESERREVDWERGRYGRLRLGDSTARVVRVLGEPRKRGLDQPLEPIGEEFHEIGGLTNVRAPRLAGPGEDDILRYRRLVLATSVGKVSILGTTHDGAGTPEGVGIGDGQDLVESRYPSANCFIQNEGTEYVTYPICKVRVCKGRLIAFGGDPIRSIWLAAETRAGLRTCRRP
jgi:hypothetical protein